MSDASLSAAVLEKAGQTPPVPWPVIEACGLPEIGTRLSGLSVHIDPDLRCPFVLDGPHVIIRPDRAATVTGSALILREAIELNSLSSGRVEWADRIIAHATALVFGATTLANRGETAACEAFSPVAAAADDILTLHDVGDHDLSISIARRIAEFLHERDQSPTRCPDCELDRAARALFLAVPTEVLLASGGDDRQIIDWHKGINTYGISPSPTPWTASFASCTASSPTVRGFDAASRLRRLLIEAALADDLDRTVAAHSTVMRRTLLAALGLVGEDGLEVVFTPSGTDAEFIPLLVALGAGEQVHSVIVGQHEIGGGSTNAAVGRHFGRHLPSGGTATAGELLNGFDPEQVTTSTVDLRDASGRMRAPDDIERDVERAIAEHADERRVLVHVVEGSKTGIRLPRREAVDRWRRLHGDRIDIVVDAAQMRVDQHTAVDHARSGSMVLVTGSKFFGGPPFSGAVLIPAALTSRLGVGNALPDGLATYLTKADVPPGLADLYAAARPGLNAGLFLRWEAALAEMRSFHNVSPEIRDEVLRVLAASLRRIIEQTSCVSVVESPYTPIPDNDRRGLDDLPTIFTFLTYGRDGKPLGVDQCDVVHERLAQDLHDVIPAEEAVLRRTFQLGRPVKIYQREGEWIGGLRLAIGAPTVSEIVFDHTKARTWTERIDRTLADIADALRKLELIVQYLDLDIDSAEAVVARQAPVVGEVAGRWQRGAVFGPVAGTGKSEWGIHSDQSSFRRG